MSRFAKTLALAATVCAAAVLPAIADRGGRANIDDAVIFKHPEFRGSALVVDGPIRNLRELGFNDKVSSIDVNGAWEICVDPDFRGRCTVIDRPQGHLSSIRMNDNITSLRPLNRSARRVGHRQDDYGRGQGADPRAHNQGIEGRRTVFFPKPRNGYREAVRASNRKADRFCRDMGLSSAAYYGENRRGNMIDLLCTK